MKRVEWEIFFGDSSSEEELCEFAAGNRTFDEWNKGNWSKERRLVISSLRNKGYKKVRKWAQAALNRRGYNWKDLVAPR